MEMLFIKTTPLTPAIIRVPHIPLAVSQQLRSFKQLARGIKHVKMGAA